MIQKSEFELRNFLPYLLNQAADASSLEFQRYYKSRYGMLRTEWRVIFHLGRYGTMTAKQICDAAGLHKTKVSRAVAALEEKRFLKREVLSTDRRHEALTLTRPGMRVFDDLSAAAQKFDSTLQAAFTPTERDVLQRCLRQIAGMTDPS